MTTRRPTVMHVTSVHPRDDVRVGYRYMTALRASDIDADLLAPRPASATGDSVSSVGRTIERGGIVGRLARIAEVTYRTLRIRPRIAHLHDPELLVVAPLFRLVGVRVVYDVHEDVVRQIDLKTWLPRPVRFVASRTVSAMYRFIRIFVHGVVVVDHRFFSFFDGVPVVLQRNFPLAGEFDTSLDRAESRRALGVPDDTLALVSVGSLSPSRAPEKLVEAARIVNLGRPTVLLFAGREQPTQFLTDHIAETGAAQFTRLLGHVNRSDVSQLLAAADIALCVLPDTNTYRTALPTKLVEYAAANTTVVASDFEVCRQFLEEFGTGTVVDPSDPNTIAAGIETAAQITTGDRGRVPRWEDDFADVVDLYGSVL